MTKEAIKQRIIELLERRNDAALLNAVHELLAAPSNGRGLRSRMERAVLEGEQDIAAGRTMSSSDLEKRIKASLRDKIRGRHR